MIDILMATYNGAKYIENQILSIIAQSMKDWKLYIHDDGSDDDTIGIIKKYQTIDARICLIEDGVRCGGPAQNFLHLLRMSKAEYVIFCDQDDVWFESKIAILHQQIVGEIEPCAVYCNAFAYNSIEITANKVSLIERSSLQNALFLNSGVQGCSLMFNKMLIEKLGVYPNNICMHDHLITMAAIAFGKLIYIDQSLMLYRQHDSNVTGNAPISFFQRIQTFFNSNNPIIDQKHYLANASFYEQYHAKLSHTQRALFKAYLDFPKLNLLARIFTIFKYNFKIGNSALVLIIKCCFKKIISK